ncbi:MAG TPA: hypothetical protein VKV23_07080 [Acidimicrobiales bacterium]|nr:hypothetical protein [Acidimicrobiales bacterium]
MRVPVMVVGGVGLGVDVMETLGPRGTGRAGLRELARRRRGAFDLVGVGRSQVGDPDRIAKVRRGVLEEIRGFTRADVSDGGELPTAVADAHRH